MRATQLDNNTYADKVMLRQTALSLLDEEPVIMETHGGFGDIYSALYTHVEQGIVFEKDASRTVALAVQRPSWAVYECDCVPALTLGAGAHLCVNYLDLDPYGSCWESIYAFFGSDLPFADRMIVVVNDGLRQKARGGGAWDCAVLEPVVQRWGNHNLWKHYLDACEWLIGDAAATAGYAVTFFDGHHCGVEKKMTHFLAALEGEPC